MDIRVANKTAHDLIMELHTAREVVTCARAIRAEVLGVYCDHEWSKEDQVAHDTFIAARRHYGAVIRSLIEYGKRNEMIPHSTIPLVCAHCGHLCIIDAEYAKCKRGKIQGILAYKKQFMWDKSIPCRFSTENRKQNHG